MQVDYPTLAKSFASLIKGETDIIALMAALVCEVHHSDDRFNWMHLPQGMQRHWQVFWATPLPLHEICLGFFTDSPQGEIQIDSFTRPLP